jgi:antitoxin component YwqK of YwqJK toxin-antitoxin module
MKTILSAILLFIILIPFLKAQGIDTVNTFSFGKIPPVYFENKLYWEKNYDEKGHLNFEALSYNSCHVGDFINYYGNGNVKTKGQYKTNLTDDWTNLKERGLCSVQVGEWKTYTETGELKSTIIYEEGKIVKEY